MKRHTYILMFYFVTLSIINAQNIDKSKYKELSFDDATRDYVSYHQGKRTAGYYKLIAHFKEIPTDKDRWGHNYISFACDGIFHSFWSINCNIPNLKRGETIIIYYQRPDGPDTPVTLIDMIEKYNQPFIVGQKYSATVNLRIRNGAGTSFSTLDTIYIDEYYSEDVIFLLEIGKEDTIDGIKSRWVRIRCKGLEGWVFGGYLDYWNLPVRQH